MNKSLGNANQIIHNYRVFDFFNELIPTIGRQKFKCSNLNSKLLTKSN